MQMTQTSMTWPGQQQEQLRSRTSILAHLQLGWLACKGRQALPAVAWAAQQQERAGSRAHSVVGRPNPHSSRGSRACSSSSSLALG